MSLCKHASVNRRSIAYFIVLSAKRSFLSIRLFCLPWSGLPLQLYSPVTCEPAYFTCNSWMPAIFGWYLTLTVPSAFSLITGVSVFLVGIITKPGRKKNGRKIWWFPTTLSFLITEDENEIYKNKSFVENSERKRYTEAWNYFCCESE